MKRVHARIGGMSVVEVIVAIAILAMGLVALTTSFLLMVRAGFGNIERVKGEYLATEGMEGVRYLRDKGWTANIETVTVGTTYYLRFGTSTWTLGTTPQTIDSAFVRTIVFGDVYRDTSTYNIVPATSTASKTLDTEARKVTVTVAWSGGGNGARSGTSTLVSYITNLFGD